MSPENDGENCVGFVHRLLGIGNSKGGFVPPTRRNAQRGLEEVSRPEDANVVGVYRTDDGYPQHVGVYNPSDRTVTHRRGPGQPVESGVPVDDALEDFEYKKTRRRFFKKV